MMSDLFSSGIIYLVKQPVNGNCGIPSLYGKVVDGSWGIEIIEKKLIEVYVIFSASNRKTLLILHIDNFGVDLTKRRLFGNKFKIIIENNNKAETLTREQLKRLVIDGTYEGEWHSRALEIQIKNFINASSMPSA